MGWAAFLLRIIALHRSLLVAISCQYTGIKIEIILLYLVPAYQLPGKLSAALSICSPFSDDDFDYQLCDEGTEAESMNSTDWDNSENQVL